MKILLTLPRPLFPADTGGKIRSLNIFRGLAKRAEIHAVSLADPVRDAAAVCEMRELFHSYTQVNWHETERESLKFYAEILANRLSPLPYFVSKYNLPQFRSVVHDMASRQGFDLVFCDFLHTAGAFLNWDFRPRVVFEHNVEFVLRQRQWRVEQHPIRKWVLAHEWKKTHAIESRVCRFFDHVITVSPKDEETIAREFDVEHLSCIPTGVDTDLFHPMNTPLRSGRLAFVGSMDWYPNEDSMVWFLNDIYPRIHARVPEVSLSIVGRLPSARLREIASKQPGVEISGRVPDVRPYLAEAEIVLVPLRIGGGTRIKIPEAMAMAKAVVSTRIGAEGLPFLRGREILIEDEAERFAQAVIELLQNKPRREAIEQAARERVVAEHGWEVVVNRLEEILSQVVRSGQKATTEELAIRP
jgi:polysaccharide biosynthesis protein PslH